MTPDLEELRARSLRATVALLREQVQSWPANGTLEGRFGAIALKPPVGNASQATPELEILVDGRAVTVPLTNSAPHEPRRLGVPAALVTPPQDVALFLLSAVAQATRRTTRLLYRPFHEIYEADADGRLTLVGNASEEDAADWP